MADLSQIPTEQLLQLFNGAPQQPAQAGPLRITVRPSDARAPDLSQVGTEELLKAYGQPAPEKSMLRNVAETVSDATNAVGKGASLGFSDELFSAGMTPLEMASGAISGEDEGKGFVQRIGDAYDRSLAFNRNFDKQAEERSPVASAVGQGVGTMMTAGGLAKQGVTFLNAAKPTAAKLIGGGAAEGAAYGGIQGFANGENMDDRLTGAVYGAGLGAATGAGVGAIASRMAGSAAAKAIPSIEDLKSQAQTAYKTAENAGVVVSPGRFQSVVGNIRAALAREGVDPTLHPGVTGALKRLDDVAGQPVTFETLDILRRVSNGAKSSLSADERRLASILSDKIDDFMTNLQPKDLLLGNGPVAGKAIKEARDLWSRMRKGEMIENLIERATTRAQQFSGSGFENALRTEFRALVLNAKAMRGFSPVEQAALKAVARGGITENILRMLGKFAPTGIVSTALSGSTGAAVGGPIGAVALPVMGLAARRAATSMTLGNAQRAANIMRAGGQYSPLQLAPGQQQMLAAGLGGGTTLQRLIYDRSNGTSQ